MTGIAFMCQSEVFNGPMCKVQCVSCKPKIVDSRRKPLTERDIETLEEVVRVAEDWRRHGFDKERQLMPMDVGGINGSHHSLTLHKLHARGLCQMKKYGSKRSKGSCRYWSNEAGIALLRQLDRLPRNMRIV